MVEAAARMEDTSDLLKILARNSLSEVNHLESQI